MFHRYLEWQAKLVKRDASAEGRGNLDHDKGAVRYIWGRDRSSRCFSEIDKKSRYGGCDLLFSCNKNLFWGLVGSANGLLIYFVAMLPANSGEINSVKD